MRDEFDNYEPSEDWGGDPDGSDPVDPQDAPESTIPPEPPPQVNGHLSGAQTNGNGPHPPDVIAWKLNLYDRVKAECEAKLKRAGPERDLALGVFATTPLENWLASLNKHRNLPNDGLTRDPSLTPVEIDEELQWLAVQLQDTFRPKVADTGEYADRQAIDAFMAYEQMKGDSREYSWDGLIREGCTAVLSGLMSSGKTTLAMNIARGWALGCKVLDRQCKQNRTLVVVSPKEYEAWAETVGFWKIKGQIFLIESTKAHFVERTEHVKWFDYTMQKHGCRTFVLDTLFDFFGMPPNTAGDSNRIAMNEQTPLLQMVRERGYSGLVTGHAPKSEARAIDPRDPEEAFGGHTAWTAQHRMRMTVRRKSQGINAFITGRGGYGDSGILKEQMLLFDDSTRVDTLAGLFAEHLGKAAMPSVIEALKALGTSVALSKLVKEMDKGEKWIRPGLKEGQKQHLIEKEGKGRATRYRAVEGVEGGLFNQKVWGEEDQELDENGIPKGW